MPNPEENKKKGDESSAIDMFPDFPERAGTVESKEGRGEDTVTNKASETAIEKKEKGLKTELNKLIKDRQEIDRELSHVEEKEARDVWLQRKEKKSREIIEQECKVLGIDSKKEFESVEAEKEKEWEKSVEAYGYNNKVSYEVARKEHFERVELPKEYNELIKANPHLSQGEKDFLINGKNGKIPAGGELHFRRVVLDKEDVALCSSLNINVHDISFGMWGLSSKVVIDGKRKREFKNLGEFNRFLAEEKEKLAEKKLEEANKKKKEDFVKGPITQLLMDKKIRELHARIEDQQKEKRRAARQEKQKERVEMSGMLTDADREDLLMQFSGKWQEAVNNYTEIKKVGRQLGAREDHIESRLQARNGKLSNEIIDIAELLSGRDLRKEASEKTGQEDYRKYLTEESKKIFDEQSKVVEGAKKKAINELLEAVRKRKEEEVKEKEEAAKKVADDVIRSVRSDKAEIVAGAKDEYASPRVEKKNLKPINFRGLSEAELAKKLDADVTNKVLSSLTGSLEKDAPKLSRIFERILNEKVSPEAFEELVDKDKYKEAAKTEAGLAGLFTDFFMDRPWEERKQQQWGHFKRTLEELYQDLPVFEAPKKNPELGKKKINSATEGLPRPATALKKRALRNVPPSTEVLNKSADALVDAKLSDEFMESLSGDFRKDAGKISQMFYETFGERIPPREFIDLVDAGRYKKSSKYKNSLARWLKGFYRQAPWEKSN